MLWNLFFSDSSSSEGGPDNTDWRGIGFALFGGAALIYAVGYALTRQAQVH